MKKLVWIILGIVLVLVIVGGIYYQNYYPYSGNAGQITERDLYCGSYYGQYNQKKIGTPDNWIHGLEGTKSALWHTPDNWQNPMSCDYQNNQNVSDETAGWKTYRDEEYGFEIKYPKDWVVKKDALNNEIILGEEKEITVDGQEMKLFKDGFTVIFYQDKSKLFGNKGNLILEEWIQKEFQPLEEGESIKNFVFGTDNYKGTRVEKYKSVGIIKIVPHIFIQHGSAIYEIQGEVPSLPTIKEFFPTEYNYDIIFEQILSTFKFTK